MVTARLAEMATKQQIAGQHMVGPDGMVTLGSYGGVSLVGMTVMQAKQAIDIISRSTSRSGKFPLEVFASTARCTTS